jgi:hypothetical protein
MRWAGMLIDQSGNADVALGSRHVSNRSTNRLTSLSQVFRGAGSTEVAMLRMDGWAWGRREPGSVRTAWPSAPRLSFHVRNREEEAPTAGQKGEGANPT